MQNRLVQSVDQDVVDLVDEFLTRIRNGEPATIDEYIARRPDLSEQISAYLPLVAMLESNGALRPSTDDIPGDTTRPISVATTLTEGSQFGRYDILELLGKGAMGTVFLAHDTELHRKVALKVPHLTDGRSAKRFAREARALAAIEHPHLCPIYDVGEVESIPYFTMALISGKTLAEILRDSETLSEQEAAELMRKVALAVHAAHESGIVHRDLKPSNIILRRAETDLTAAPPTDEVFANLEPVVMDFGLASLSREGDAKLTHDGAIVGSPAYMSPEQIESDSDRIGPPADVYALGVVLFEILSGQRPFEGKLLAVLRDVTWEAPPELSTLRSDVAPELAAICRKAMAKQPEDRYASAAKLAEALDSFLDSEARSPRSVRPLAAFAGLAAVVVLLAVGVGLIATHWNRQEPVTGHPEPDSATPSAAEIATDSNDESQSALDASNETTPMPETLFVKSEFGFDESDARWAVAVADFNGDERIDLFVPGVDDPGYVWFGTGAGQFERADQPLDHELTSWVSAGDLDGDGDVDVFASSHGRRDHVWINDGTGRFEQKAQQFELMASRINVLVDIDGDGDLDVALAVDGDADRVWLNDGDGTFGKHVSLEGDSSYGVTAGDIDNDGDADLVFSGRTLNQPLRFWRNDGNAVFSRLPLDIVFDFSHAVQLVDLNADDRLDLCVGGSAYTATQILLADGNGAFTAGKTELPMMLPSSFAHGDLDGDGDIDLVTGNGRDQPNEVLLNDGQGHFERKQTLENIFSSTSLTDVDGDGDLDIIVSDGSIWLNQSTNNSANREVQPTENSNSDRADHLLPPRPSPTFEKLGEFFEVGQSIGEGIRAVSLGDLDNDGDLDAFLAMYRWKLRVMLNDGKGRFSSGPSVPDPDQWRNWEVELCDVDADGYLDAFVTKMGQDRLWLNDGHASFTDSGQDFGVGDSNRARFGDLDGDGDPDLFVTQKRRCSIWFNRGSGQFEDSGQLLGQDDHSDCDLGDIDGDGDLDVFVVARNAPHRVWVNDGQGVFSDSGQRLGEAMSVGVQLCDYDGDGDLDAFVANRTVPAEVWRNDGHGEFSLAQHGAPSDDVSSILVIDIDGDSDLDVFQQSTHQAPEVLWINDGQSVFAKQVQLPPAQIGRFDAGDLDGDGDIDIFADRIWINQLGE